MELQQLQHPRTHPAVFVCACVFSFSLPQERLQNELNQLIRDIRRIGNNTDECSFGALFDDDTVQNYYEALVGTLTSAKKRGYIDYPGRLLLKGVSDNVVIRIVSSGANGETA